MGEEPFVWRLVVSQGYLALESEDRVFRFLSFNLVPGVDKGAALEYFMAAVDTLYVRPVVIPEEKC